MNKHYKEIELINPKSPSYIANNKRYKKTSNMFRKHKRRDPFASEYNIELQRWESVVQRLLSTLICEEENRILKYIDGKKGYQYREVDFIGRNSSNRLTFCELKLKANFKEKLGSKESGRSQLNKSISIANHKYNNIGGLAICIDMSYVYGDVSNACMDSYSKFMNVLSYFLNGPTKVSTIWLSSIEICNLALQYKLLTQTDIDRMRKVHKEQLNPLSILTNEKINEPNNPFGMLRNLSQIHSYV